jgi:prepilin-type N-terminal cleavage/methylation domain-containing protein
MPSTRKDAGFTIIEVLVAALILVIASMTTFTLLSSATKNAVRAKGTQVALDRAQQEVEKLRSLTNKELAMTSAPQFKASALDPGNRVNAGTGSFALRRSPRSEYETMVYNGRSLWGGGEVAGGVVNSGPVPFSSGDVSGKVYRYIVWRNDERCSEALCPGPEDYKQIVVAVKLDSKPNMPAERGYVEVQSNFVDPKDSSANDPKPGAEGVVTAQQFYLTDTPCAASGITERQEITGEHLLHNTLGTCASGLHNETTKGAPDALMLGAPPDPAPEDPSLPVRYDYANDFYLEPTPDTDKGLQIRRDNTSGCNYTPVGSIAQSQVHRWVTDPMAANFKLSGKVTLKLFTRTLSNSTYKAGICVFLFKRHEAATTTDTLLANKVGGSGFWTYTESGLGNWPTVKIENGVEEWPQIAVEMDIASAPYLIPAGDRVGMAVTVDPAKMSPGFDAIGINYDFPSEPSRLEVETTTPIDGG